MSISPAGVLRAQYTQVFLWLPVFFGCGVAVYFSLPAEPSAFLVDSLVAGCLALIIVVVILPPAPRAALVLLLMAVLGFVDASWQANRVAAPVLQASFRGYVEGTVTGISRSASNAPRVSLSDVVLAGKARHKTPAHVRISLLGWVAPGVLVPGQRITATVNLSPPGAPVEPGGFDFRRLAWFQQLGAVGYTRHPVLVAGPRTTAGMAGWIFRMRMQISDSIRARIEGQNGAFAAAILTGDRSAIDPAVTNVLRASNLAHLLAISGLHMGLLTGFVFMLVRYGLAMFPIAALRFQSKKLGACAALMAGLCYLVLSGASVATQRAFLMAAVMLLAVLLDRPAFTLRAVALAALLILAWRPDSLTGAGFQMSFAATTALVAAFDWLRGQAWWMSSPNRLIRFARPVLVLAISSGVAGAATAPFSAFHFNQAVPFGLFANLLAVPLMGLVVMPSAVLGFVLWPIGLEGFAFEVMGRGIGAILNVATYFSTIPGAVRKVTSGGPYTLVFLTLGGIFFLLWRGKLRAIGLVVVLCGFLDWHATERPDILISDGARLVGYTTPNGRALSRKRGEGFAARTWLENDGDAVDQVQAWGRLDREKSDIGWSARLANDWLLIVAGEGASDKLFADKCGKRIVILAVAARAPTQANCLIIGKDAIDSLGAMSLHLTKSGALLSGARDPQEKRLWSGAAQ